MLLYLPLQKSLNSRKNGKSLTGCYNPGQNIWNKTEKFGNIKQARKNLISTFACFLAAIAKM